LFLAKARRKEILKARRVELEIFEAAIAVRQQAAPFFYLLLTIHHSPPALHFSLQMLG
jgi:hypothetical protein